MRFSRQQYCSGLLCPPPGDFPNPGIKPVFLLSPALASRYFTTRQYIKKQRHYFTDKGPSSQSYVFFSSHVWMWVLDYKESWSLKNGYFCTVVLEKFPESPLDCKEDHPVLPKGNQSWIFTGRTDAEVETPVLTWCKELTHWKSPWCWQRLKAGGQGDDRGWDG